VNTQKQALLVEHVANMAQSRHAKKIHEKPKATDALLAA
jgi:hypothetical protein